MSNQNAETITKFEVMFAARTGVTVLVPKVAAFDGAAGVPIFFHISPDDPQDAVISAGDKAILLKGMKKEHLAAAAERGFIMFYEMQGEDIVRSTLCNHQKT